MVRRPNLSLLALLAVAFAAQGRAYAGSPGPLGRRISVHVDSVVASDTHEGVDPRLDKMRPRLQSLFNYSTYRLISHQDGQADTGQLVSFDLPGGRILHLQPHEVEGNMIGMELVLFQGEKPFMTTDLKLRDHGVLFVGGPRYEQGMLIISIEADTTGPRSNAETGHPYAATSAAAR